MATETEVVSQQEQTADGATLRERGVQRTTALVDVYENDDEILILADMPGVEPDGVDLRLESSEVRVCGTQARPSDADPNWLPLEFQRAFTVPDSVAADRVSAELKGGVLHLKLGKGEHAKPKRIVVTSG